MPHKDLIVRAAYMTAYRRKHSEKLNARQREYTKTHPRTDHLRPEVKERRRIARSTPEAKEQLKIRQLKSNYDISLREWQEIWKRQGGKCGMCDKPMAPLPDRMTHTDHDHTSGKVRGLLCGRCNRGLHYVEDAEFREAGLRYLGVK
jgi:hypothetical protein